MGRALTERESFEEGWGYILAAAAPLFLQCHLSLCELLSAARRVYPYIYMCSLESKLWSTCTAASLLLQMHMCMYMIVRMGKERFPGAFFLRSARGNIDAGASWGGGRPRASGGDSSGSHGQSSKESSPWLPAPALHSPADFSAAAATAELVSSLYSSCTCTPI